MKWSFLSGYLIRYTLYYTSTIFFTPFQMTNKNDNRESKREKLRNFENWPQWTDLTQAMFEEKDVCDVVDRSHANPTTAA